MLRSASLRGYGATCALIVERSTNSAELAFLFGSRVPCAHEANLP